MSIMYIFTQCGKAELSFYRVLVIIPHLQMMVPIFQRLRGPIVFVTFAVITVKLILMHTLQKTDLF